jgi:protein gp37
MELFGEWVEPGWLNTIFRVVESHPQHTFIFLTKRPENLARWSPFPPNCWVGYSATDSPTAWNGMAEMVNNHVQAKVKFASFEPLLGEIGSRMMSTYAEYGINWLIIGQQTPASPKTAPKIEWIREIVEASDKAGIPVFLKNNLSDMELPWNGDYYYEHGDTLTDKLRQEFPEVK